MSGIVKIPKELKTTDVGYLKKLAEVFPKQPKDAPKYGYGRNENFHLRDWLVDHGINFRESSAWGNGEKYILDCCPFDSSHKGKDAAVFQSRDGVLGFHCFHDSCSDKRWADFRNLVEPGYKDKYQSESKRIYKQYNRDKPEQSKIVPQENEPVFLSLTQIINKPKVEDTYIKTGIEQLDKKVRGLKKGGLTLVSGLRGCGKSTLLSQWMVEAVNDGYNVACYSGELTDRNFAAWMIQQAAGKPFVKPSQWENQYNVPRKWQEVIAQWMDGHFWLYNNKYGNNFVAIMEQLEKVIDEKKIDLLIFDNLMTFDLRGLSDNKYDAQTEFVLKLSSLAKSKNVAICFIAHPRKSDGFLRLQDIAGTADLTNAVDFAFIAHRVDEDFKRLSMQMFGWKEGYDIYNSTNVIEIAKDREFGNIDKFIPMWFEVESRRMKNDPTETKFYGWCKQKEPDEEEFDLGIDDWDDSGETPFDAE
jgi:archaellum biogenesis ATPase FlaH